MTWGQFSLYLGPDFVSLSMVATIRLSCFPHLLEESDDSRPYLELHVPEFSDIRLYLKAGRWDQAQPHPAALAGLISPLVSFANM